MLQGGNVWVKVSGAYRLDQDPSHPLVQSLARWILRTRPDRCVFATDWPHTRFEDIDVTRYLDQLFNWCDAENVSLGSGALVAQRIAVEVHERLNAMQREGRLPAQETCDLLVFDRQALACCACPCIEQSKEDTQPLSVPSSSAKDHKAGFAFSANLSLGQRSPTPLFFCGWCLATCQ